MSDEHRPMDAECVEKPPQPIRDRDIGVLPNGLRAIGASVTGHVGSHRAIARRGERLHLVSVAVAEAGEAVTHHDRGSYALIVNVPRETIDFDRADRHQVAGTVCMSS